jgi:hypothetical protein
MDRISRRDAKRNAESAEKNHEILLPLFFMLSAETSSPLRETLMDRISRRDAKRTAESAEKNHEILLLFFFALSAVRFASLRETSWHFASLRETSWHSQLLSQPIASFRETLHGMISIRTFHDVIAVVRPVDRLGRACLTSQESAG